jgi:hypothetical protein
MRVETVRANGPGFSLAGKDIAARYLDVLNIKKSDHVQ